MMTDTRTTDPVGTASQEELDARRGFIAALKPAIVHKADGTVAFDTDAYAFLDAPAPGTAHRRLGAHARRDRPGSAELRQRADGAHPAETALYPGAPRAPAPRSSGSGGTTPH